MEQQEVMLEKLKLELLGCNFQGCLIKLEGPISSLLNLSKRWEVKRLHLPKDLDTDSQQFWTNLANIPFSAGHIGFIFSPPEQHPLDNLHLNTLRKAWEIAEKIQVVQFTIQGPGAYQMHDFQGGKAINLDLEAEWQRVLEVIQ